MTSPRSRLPALSGSRLLLAALLAAATARADDAPSPVDVLRDFSAAASADISRAIDELGADASATRRAAQKRLTESKALTSAHLAGALRSDDPEISQRAEELAANAVEQNEKRLADALATIASGNLKGQAAAVAETLPACDAVDRLRIVWRRAFIATCTTNDGATVGALLASPSASAREAALTAADQLKLPDAPARLHRSLGDADETVRLQAASLLLDAGDVRALPVTIDLLESGSVAIRSRSHAILRAVTGRSSDFLSDDAPALRARAVADWRKWLADADGKPALTAGQARGGAIVLATPEDLEKWVAHTVDTKKAWSIRDGVLACDGRGNGVLISPEPLANYSLTYEWRWTGRPGDSGLFTGIEALGADSLRAIEVQMLAGAAGDFWRIGYYTGADGAPIIPNHVRRLAEAEESPENGWNLMEITLQNGRLDVHVNGRKVNELDGLPSTPTHFGLQLEGTAFEVRRLRADPLP